MDSTVGAQRQEALAFHLPQMAKGCLGQEW